MFASIPSLDAVLQCLLPAFTQPSFQTHIQVLLGWVMCLGKRTEYGVFQTIQADAPVSRKDRHPFDRFYNFFSRSAWAVRDLAHQVAVAVVVALNPLGLLYLVVDDTLLHKRGKHVYGLGWFRDAVASTAKRVVTASGNHWVVVGLAIVIPGTSKIYCLPIHAKLHLAGKSQKSEA
ncbi:MAG: transposase, partial [Planctomycetes bacterium]|nr:transposase [Planctomycetota bacterium]